MQNESKGLQIPFMPKVKGDTNLDIISQSPVMNFIMQASMTAQLSKMRRLEESKVPTGSKSHAWNVTDSLMEIILDQPWISFSLTNKSTSTGSVFCRINSEEGPLTDEAEIEPGESQSWDFDYPIIHRLFLQAESGKSATVKVRAEVGRWA